MIKLYNTNEVASKANISERSVRRRIENKTLGAYLLTSTNGKKAVYGITQEQLNNYLVLNKN